MVFVITADQRNSRSSPDRVEAMLDQLNSGQTLRRFERTAGDEVQEGQALATVEAMKMENILRAERRGVVKAVKAEAGQSLRVDDVIMEFE